MVRRIAFVLSLIATLALTSSCNVMTSDGFVSGPNQNFLQSDGGTPSSHWTTNRPTVRPLTPS